MSDMLTIQVSLLKASGKELRRTDLLNLTGKEQFKHTDFEPNSFVLVQYQVGLS